MGRASDVEKGESSARGVFSVPHDASSSSSPRDTSVPVSARTLASCQCSTARPRARTAPRTLLCSHTIRVLLAKRHSRLHVCHLQRAACLATRNCRPCRASRTWPTLPSTRNSCAPSFSGKHCSPPASTRGTIADGGAQEGLA